MEAEASSCSYSVVRTVAVRPSGTSWQLRERKEYGEGVVGYLVSEPRNNPPLCLTCDGVCQIHVALWTFMIRPDLDILGKFQEELEGNVQLGVLRNKFPR